MTKIRTRYAPSPTGYFHIGGARTVILNYLYARHFNGEFVVRIEDTDQERNIKQGIASQLDGIKWLGIEPDESPNKPGKFGPYIQSKKFAKFAKLAFDLVKQKKAYYCFCTQNELEKARQVANKNKATPKYNRKCLMLSDAQIQKNLQANKPFVIRLKLKDNYDYQ
jgi:glutamyl-tRNA synthetase